MEDQKNLVEELKKKEGTTLLPGIAVVVNDWADRADITHANNNPITSSYIRARHWGQSTFVVSQKLARGFLSVGCHDQTKPFRFE